MTNRWPICSMTTTSAIGETSTIACQLNDGNEISGSPSQAACSTAEKSTIPKQHESAYATTAPASTGIVHNTFLPKHVHAMTVPSDTKATTSAGHELTAPSVRKASLTAVADNPQPITRIIDAITIGGIRRSIHAVPMRRISRAHAMNINPAHTIAEPIPAAPAAADAITIGPIKLNEGPR